MATNEQLIVFGWKETIEEHIKRPIKMVVVNPDLPLDDIKATFTPDKSIYLDAHALSEAVDVWINRDVSQMKWARDNELGNILALLKSCALDAASLNKLNALVSQ